MENDTWKMTRILWPYKVMNLKENKWMNLCLSTVRNLKQKKNFRTIKSISVQ